MSSRRFITALSVVALRGRALAAIPGVLQIPFTNDAVPSLNQPAGEYGIPGRPTYIEALAQARMGLYGPDGPWQAVAISVGDFASTDFKTPNPYSGVWPTIDGMSYLLGKQAGGNYTTADPQPQTSISIHRDNPTYFTNATIKYRLQYDDHLRGVLSVHRLGGGTSDYNRFKFTTEIVEMDGWEVSLPNGNKFTQKTGLLGMKAVLKSLTGNGCTTACTQEDLNNIGGIASRTFSLHIGSTITGQQGSFALGGYEQTRIVGPVGVFDVTPMDSMPNGMPIVFLRDFFLGVESGFSPFPTDRTDNISVFTGLPFEDVRSPVLNAKLRARPGSVVVEPSAAAPGIYLPRYLCEGVARHLPVILDPSTGYYFWDTASPFYNVVVNSAGYLGFVFSDRNARNITIKVPFILLNLNLEPPLVPVLTKYFPCHSSPSSQVGTWFLGRAFLQAAFFGYSLDQNVSYLAQAPGPDIDQSLVRPWRPESVGVPEDASLPLDAFYKSWSRHMFRLNSPLDPVSGLPTPVTDRGGVDGGLVGGIIGGAMGGLVFAALVMWGVVSRLRREETVEGGDGVAAVELGGLTELVELGDEKVCEKGVDVVRFEMGDERAVELGAGRDGEVSPGRDRMENHGAEGTEGSEGTIETERTVVEKNLEGQDIFQMPGDEPLGLSGEGNEGDTGVETGLNGRRNMAEEDSAAEKKTVSEREDRPKGGG